MHRNTYLLVSILAVVAALLIGINVGRRFGPQGQSAQAPPPTPSPEAITPPATTLVPYINSFCGFSLEYPSTLTKYDNASGSAILTNSKKPAESVAITCQEEIPRPPLPPEQIEPMTIWNTAKTSSISAKLYHDASPKDGTPMDALIFRHPKTGLDVFLAGYGPIFQSIIDTLTILN